MEGSGLARDETVVVERNLVEIAVVQRPNGVEGAESEYPSVGCIRYFDLVIVFVVPLCNCLHYAGSRRKRIRRRGFGEQGVWPGFREVALHADVISSRLEVCPH